MPSATLLQLALRDRHEMLAAQIRLGELLGDSAQIITDGRHAASVRMISLEDLPAHEGNADVVAVGDTDLPSLVALLRKHPWLDHVLSARLIASDSAGLVASALRRLLSGGRQELAEPTEGGPAESASITDSDARQAHLDAICASARQGGASPLVVERIRDVAEETITNALYDAPAEANRPTKDRSERVQLEADLACQVTYGVVGRLFVLRVRDSFGSFRRDRLCEVLDRCARQEGVSLDTSRGGAGLGMWRVFSAATVIVIHVVPGEKTEITLALDLQRRSTGGARAVHLFFDSKAPA